MPRRYHDPFVIRSNAAFRVLGARRHDGDRVTLVVPARASALDRAREALGRALEAHRRIEHPLVPSALSLEELEGRPVLEIRVAAIADATELWRRLVLAGQKLSYAAADALIRGVADALEAAHRARDPRTGRPICLGRMCGGNTLFDDRGNTHVVGFGHNFVVEDEEGRPDYQVPFFEAPELGWGAPSSPEGDYVALMRLRTSGLNAVSLTDVLRRAIEGVFAPGDRSLLELVLWVERRVVGAVPAQRASWAESRQVGEEIRRMMGVIPDPEGLAATVRAVFSDESLTGDDGGGPVLAVGPDGEWMTFDGGEPQSLRGPMRRILSTLVDRQVLALHDPVRSVDLIDVGWPEEQAEYESALNRVYVTMSRLRRLLSDEAIERFDDGYRLSPRVVVRRSSRHVAA